MTHSSWLHDCAEGMNSNTSLLLTFPSDSSRTVNEGDVQTSDLRSGNWRTVGDVARDISGIVNFWKNFAVALHQLWLGGKSRMTLDSLCTCCRWMSFEAWWMFSDVDVPRGVPFILGVQERHSTCFTITSCKRWSWKLSNYVKSFVTERLSSDNIDVYKYVCIYIYLHVYFIYVYYSHTDSYLMHFYSSWLLVDSSRIQESMASFLHEADDLCSWRAWSPESEREVVYL